MSLEHEHEKSVPQQPRRGIEGEAPSVLPMEGATRAPIIERADKFRQARITKFFPQSGYGFVKDQKGHEIYFHLDELRFVGPKQARSHVVEGASVGIDVSRTSRGMRVIRLKID